MFFDLIRKHIPSEFHNHTIKSLKRIFPDEIDTVKGEQKI
jgi:hypothetical protein